MQSIRIQSIIVSFVDIVVQFVLLYFSSIAFCHLCIANCVLNEEM